jgi:hypothetical protein
MFLFGNAKKKLEEQVKELEAQIQAMSKFKDPADQLKLNVVYDDIDSSTHVFDWAIVNAFSIERQIKQEQGELVAYTIIGYIRADGDTGEWSYICSQEEHNRLAADFALYVAMKNQPKPVKAPPKEVAPSKVTRK